MAVANEETLCICLLFSICVLLMQIAAERSPPRLLPFAEKRESRKVVTSGSVVHLTCPVERNEKEELFIDWIKDGESLTTYDPRIRKTSGGTLKIKEVVPEDTGLYLCRAVNGFGSVEIGTTLIVLDEEEEDITADNSTSGLERSVRKFGNKPILTEVSKFSHSIIQRPFGGTVKFKCVAAGNPRPLLTWFRNGHILHDKELKKRRWTLTLTDLKAEDTGNYTCIAFNSNGNASASFNLEVMGTGNKAEIRELYPGNITVEEGGKVTFNCRVYSEIKPHIQWLKRMNRKELNQESLSSVDINRNNKYGQHILEFEGKQFRVLKAQEADLQEDGSILNKLILKNLKPDDSGQYACLGASLYGYDFKSALLNVNPQLQPLPPILNQVVEDNFPVWMMIVIFAVGICIVIMACVCYAFHKRCQKRNAANSTLNASSFIAPSVGKASLNARTSLNYETNIIYSQAPSSSFSPRINSELRHSIKDKRSSSVSPSHMSSAPRTLSCEYYRFPEGKSYGYLC